MLRRVICQVTRLQAPVTSVCSEEEKLKILAAGGTLIAASSLGSPLNAYGSTNRSYHTRLWGGASQSSDGRDVASQVLETSKILRNRNAIALDWSPHGLSLIPRLAARSLQQQHQDETDEEDEPSDDKMMVRKLS
jgi:hypothetical protein